ncbi:hypothetical protein [Pseudomonas sp. G5(2012)]|uniref:hypothetical protein n=1 Tax=Pseudomonas sp. G5(2012) TaxID=1268068 RepID=UPI0003431251|nr:hypothetical protein [Pseudomonas sp. G5(2012)]EPA95524.1 hypothetical protein PG5_40350 [Pseudomonas sp. G5(2012)]
MTAEVATETKRKVQPLAPSSMMFEDARVVRHVVFVPRDTDPKVLTESGYWLSVAQRLTPLAHLMVFWDDRSAMANLLCTEASQSYVSMLLLDYRKLPGIISDGSEALINFEIFYSQMNGYCARRLSDNVMVIQDASSKEKCIEALKSHPAFKAE